MRTSRALLLVLIALALAGCVVTPVEPYPYSPAYAYPGCYRCGPYYGGYYHRYHWQQFP